MTSLSTFHSAGGALSNQSDAAETGLLNRQHGVPDLAEIEICVSANHDLGVLLIAHRRAKAFAEVLERDRFIVDPKLA
jgi:hypothetical protein